MNRTSNQKYKLLIMRYLPILRYLKHKHIQSKIDRDYSFYKFKKYSRQTISLADIPSGVDIGITSYCNINCRMCRTHFKKHSSHMDEKTFTDCITQVKRIAKSVSFHTTGEPTVHPLLSSFVSIAHKNDIRVAISTNAQRPDTLKSLYENHRYINGFRFSVDGIQDVYEYIRDGAKWEKVATSCEWIHKVNKGRRMSNIALTVDCILTKDNIHQISSYMDFFSQYTYPKDISFNIANSLSADTSYFHESRFNGIYESGIPCSQPFRTMVFEPDGTGHLCCRDYDDALNIGDASKDILSAWESKRARDIRDLHINGKIPICNRCLIPKAGVSENINRLIHALWREGAGDLEIKYRILGYIKGL